MKHETYTPKQNMVIPYWRIRKQEDWEALNHFDIVYCDAEMVRFGEKGCVIVKHIQEAKSKTDPSEILVDELEEMIPSIF